MQYDGMSCIIDGSVMTVAGTLEINSRGGGMNNLCNGCKWYYYVRGWNPDDPNATCRHERDNSGSTQSEEQLNVEVVE